MKTSFNGRHATPSLEASGAKRSGLLEVRMSTGETIILWVHIERKTKSARLEQERAADVRQEATIGTESAQATRVLRERLTQWKGIARVGNQKGKSPHA